MRGTGHAPETHCPRYTFGSSRYHSRRRVRELRRVTWNTEGLLCGANLGREPFRKKFTKTKLERYRLQASLARAISYLRLSAKLCER